MGRIISFVIVCALLFYILGDSVKGVHNKSKQKYKRHIGKKVVIAKDTLTIMDYSIIEDNFTLSNGVEIDYNFVINREKF